ncbi:hypothetical protein Agabi119p4_9721 [Agaricus bisporus var. burnettii]|uniref:phosphatidylinositol-3,4,5-trisphosphate 3-phosphatase n=1 Tax=Agaricus bisporus var. burnettii TaxID=192524 RepID=A0A8H7C2Y7_AGABI|nr:hypothetical protein Agabi119p4_9721 [Agaricus bisporus var. burnettii]
MADFIRRLISGNKSRFKDDELGLELDLVYVTNQIIIMGYPAKGLEGYYRNKRSDAKKFLDHRHGKNYWIFNFCPLGENSYDPQYFEGRVSRYPFPDHHAPPLAIMPLAAREMRAWLNSSPERVVVLHCKAGKGRSGTMACAYLVALHHDEPTPPNVRHSDTEKERVEQRVEETIDVLPAEDQDHLENIPATNSPSESDTHAPTETPTHTSALAEPLNNMASTLQDPDKSITEGLKEVLDLHTSRRMKPRSSPDKKQKQGVSIPSQRRFLYYWALCLADEAPDGFWSLNSISPSPSPLGGTGMQKHVRMTEIKIHFRELSKVKMRLLKAANMVIEKGTSKMKDLTGSNQVWASLARYDDEFVSTLERWEKYSRDENGRLAIRRSGSEYMGSQGEGEEERLEAMFGDGKWDSHKMVRVFSRLGAVGPATRVQTQRNDTGEKVSTHTLRPLNKQSWEGIRKDIMDASSGEQIPQVEAEDFGIPAHENSIMDDPASRPGTLSGTSTDGISLSSKPDQDRKQGVLLNAEREVRIKLYMGQVFMGWIWLIPTFHMPHPPLETQDADGTTTQTIRLSRKDVDFPIGLGAGIIDVEISLKWDINRASSHPYLNREETGALVNGKTSVNDDTAEAGTSSGVSLEQDK